MQLAAGTRKWLHVDLKTARLVALKRYPFSVRRELAVAFIVVRLHDRKWLPISIQSHCPDIVAVRLRVSQISIQHKTSIGRPIHLVFGFWGCEHQFGCTTRSCHFVEIEGTLLV